MKHPMLWTEEDVGDVKHPMLQAEEDILSSAIHTNLYYSDCNCNLPVLISLINQKFLSLEAETSLNQNLQNYRIKK